MTTCRFELKILGTKRFKCAVKFGPDGWAYEWKHDGLHDPCPNCKYHIDGDPLTVAPALLDSSEFCETAGARIRAKDWNELEKRGLA